MNANRVDTRATSPDRIAVCQHPGGPGEYVPAEHINDGRCFMDCDCTPRVYTADDAQSSGFHRAAYWEERAGDWENMYARMCELRDDALLRERRIAAERDQLAWVIRELHEGACSPAYRPPDSDYRLWALEVIEREASDVFPQSSRTDPSPASTESSHGSEDTDG